MNKEAEKKVTQCWYFWLGIALGLFMFLAVVVKVYINQMKKRKIRLEAARRIYLRTLSTALTPRRINNLDRNGIADARLATGISNDPPQTTETNQDTQQTTLETNQNALQTEESMDQSIEQEYLGARQQQQKIKKQKLRQKRQTLQQQLQRIEEQLHQPSNIDTQQSLPISYQSYENLVLDLGEQPPSYDDLY